MQQPVSISVLYNSEHLSGSLQCDVGAASSPAWERFKVIAISDPKATLSETSIEMPWPSVLGIIREYGTRQVQESLNFRFSPSTEASEKIRVFASELRQTRAARNSLTNRLSPDEIVSSLKQKGFTQRDLKSFQIRDVAHLLSLPHGANFSVPGAGKTTVMFALHVLTQAQDQHLFVVGPKAAFPAWREVVSECMAPESNSEPFTVLDRSSAETQSALRSGATRFLMTYDLMIRQQDILAPYFAQHKVHLVLDEAHRMKAGIGSQRGAFLLQIAALPIRRDILTGTPMPQGASDLASQLAFLWPGQGLNLQIDRGVSPRDVLGNLYVRTTKHELMLPPVTRRFYDIPMAPGQLALYSTVRDETLRQLTLAIQGGRGGVDYIRARRSIMRLLQLSTNPVLALKSIVEDFSRITSGIVDQVLNEGPSLKMRAVADHARSLALQGRRSVIWTIFTDSIHELERMLADLNPVSLYGAIPSGDADDLTTREARLKRFHNDPSCFVMIANPAAAGEGISLHTVCHDAIYLDRSYVSTHYLQSQDRIHRLGLPPNVETFIHIYRTLTPMGVGSVDFSVNRRLATKVRNLQMLLDDPDLHQMALDEENAGEPIDYDLKFEDLIDLVTELEGRGGSAQEQPT